MAVLGRQCYYLTNGRRCSTHNTSVGPPATCVVDNYLLTLSRSKGVLKAQIVLCVKTPHYHLTTTTLPPHYHLTTTSLPPHYHPTTTTLPPLPPPQLSPHNHLTTTSLPPYYHHTTTSPLPPTTTTLPAPPPPPHYRHTATSLLYHHTTTSPSHTTPPLPPPPYPTPHSPVTLFITCGLITTHRLRKWVASSLLHAGLWQS